MVEFCNVYSDLLSFRVVTFWIDVCTHCRSKFTLKKFLESTNCLNNYIAK